MMNPTLLVAIALASSAYTFPDPCSLDSVTCLDEQIREVSAYNSVPGQTDDTPCIAADGTDICERYAAGELICASNAFPMGTRLHVDGYGTCTVADRMNRRYTDVVDVYFGMDIDRAWQWGRKKVLVSIVENA